MHGLLPAGTAGSAKSFFLSKSALPPSIFLVEEKWFALRGLPTVAELHERGLPNVSGDKKLLLLRWVWWRGPALDPVNAALWKVWQSTSTSQLAGRFACRFAVSQLAELSQATAAPPGPHGADHPVRRGSAHFAVFNPFVV